MEKAQKNEKNLQRLLETLDFLGVKKYGRVKKVAEVTGYSEGQVSEILSGKVPLTRQFRTIICMKYGISEEFIKAGTGNPILSDPHALLSVKEESLPYGHQPELTPAEKEALDLLRIDPDAREMIEAYLKLPRSRRKRHVSEMLADVEKIEEGE